MDQWSDHACGWGIINFKSVTNMGLFKKRTRQEKLERKHAKLLEEAFRLSRTDRTAGDQKYAEAEALLKEIESLEGK